MTGQANPGRRALPAVHRAEVKARHARMAALYRDEGLSCRQIAAALGISRQAVWRSLVTAGVTLRAPALDAASAPRVRELRAQGRLLKQIAHEFGCSITTVSRCLRGRR